MEYSERLSKWRKGKMRGRKPTLQSVRKQVAGILSAQHMKTIIWTEVQEKDGYPRLTFRTVHQALQSIADRKPKITMSRMNSVQKKILKAMSLGQ